MREVRYGDLLYGVSEGLIIHQVNAQGVMHRGFAGALRIRHPKVWEDYISEIKPHPTKEESKARLGKVIWSEASPRISIASIVGQQFYGSPDELNAPRYTSYDAVDEALRLIGDVIRGLSGEPGPEVHYPLLGSHRGGGHWPVIRSILDHRLHGIKQTLWLLPGTTEPA